MARRIIAVIALSALLSACGGNTPRPASASGRAASTRVPPTKPAPPMRPPPEAQVLHAPGLEGVIGATGPALLRQFGQPRLDVHEGDVRKLQFSGRACVLDIFLYPPKGGGEPAATYAEARRGSDGQEVDRAACVAALRR